MTFCTAEAELVIQNASIFEPLVPAVTNANGVVVFTVWDAVIWHDVLMIDWGKTGVGVTAMVHHSPI